RKSLRRSTKRMAFSQTPKVARAMTDSVMPELDPPPLQGPGRLRILVALRTFSVTSSATSSADAIRAEADRSAARIFATTLRSPWNKLRLVSKPRSPFRGSKTVTLVTAPERRLAPRRSCVIFAVGQVRSDFNRDFSRSAALAINAAAQVG